MKYIIADTNTEHNLIFEIKENRYLHNGIRFKKSELKNMRTYMVNPLSLKGILKDEKYKYVEREPKGFTDKEDYKFYTDLFSDVL